MLWLLAICLTVAGLDAARPICQRAPPDAPTQNYYLKLSISGEPDLFIPGEIYSVSIECFMTPDGGNAFDKFLVWAEFEDSNDDGGNKTKLADRQALGSFRPYDGYSKIHEDCEPAISNVPCTALVKAKVLWLSSSINTDVCVRICARVVYVVSDEVVVLVRKLCPAPIPLVPVTRQPLIVEPCCACDEARYEMTFEGLWSRNTHPQGFPPESARAHFGDIIGASHSWQYRLWQEGRTASSGLRRLGEDGSTKVLEKELKDESERIRTIIKARGISWQQIRSPGMPSTSAMFRVDSKHHLVSLASKLAPSPDWIVGVSALELCTVNCTWRESVTISLYPYDIGTDNGVGYTSRRQPSIPQAPVRALRPDWPNDPNSPFYSPTGEMRPLARIRLNRRRLYEKSCNVTNTNKGKVVDDSSDPGISKVPDGPCDVYSWGSWGPCSVTCGLGRTLRQRYYKSVAKAKSEGCYVPLTDFGSCHGPRTFCHIQSQYEPEPASDTGPCAVSQWTEWSPCQGCGVRARTRHYIVPRANKHCHRGFRARTVLSQAMPCEAGPCYERPKSLENYTNFEWFYIDNPRNSCATSGWGPWSPCAGGCSLGRRLRTRLLIAPKPKQHLQPAITRHLIAKWNKRFTQLQNIELINDTVIDEDPEITKSVLEYLAGCHATQTMQESLCDKNDPVCLNQTISLEDCTLPRSEGPCRGYEERWFFDTKYKQCEPFGYTGCGGNVNNFRTHEACERACVFPKNAKLGSTSVPEVSTNRIKATVSIVVNKSVQNDSPSKGPRVWRSTSFPVVSTKRIKATPSTVVNEVIQNDSPSKGPRVVQAGIRRGTGLSESGQDSQLQATAMQE